MTASLTFSSHVWGRTGCSAIPAKARSSMSPAPADSESARASALPPVVRLRSRRLARSFCMQLREVVARTRRILQSGRKTQVVLHSGSVSRGHVLALSQSRQRHVRRRHRGKRNFRQQFEITGSALFENNEGNHDGWPDLLVANDTQPNKLYRNQRNGTFKDAGGRSRTRLQRAKARRAQAWESTWPISTIPVSPESRSPTSTTR
jgi:hypothetical protein